MKKQVVILTFLMAIACQAVEVASVSAKQRWPWNNLVDIDFSLTGTAGEKYLVNVDAQCAGGTKKFSATSFATEPIAIPGANRVTWDFGKDYPGIRAEDMAFAVSVTPMSGSDKPLYLVVDLSAGPLASAYPVRYTMTGPAHVMGAEGEACQTTELWLKRIEKPARDIVYRYYTYREDDEDAFFGRQTKDFYIGVFEVTQRQYELVMGSDSNPSYFTNATCYASRPVENVTMQNHLVGVSANIQVEPEKIAATSFFGKIRTKTGLLLTLPTSMQAEWAMRGGDFNIPYTRCYVINGVEAAWADIARYAGNNAYQTKTRDSDLSVGTAAVGSYLPNMFGLYDTMGNVSELTCERIGTYNKRFMRNDLAQLREEAGDQTLGKSEENPIIDYKGFVGSGNSFRVTGGNWQESLPIWTQDSRESGSWNNNLTLGFRLSLTID